MTFFITYFRTPLAFLISTSTSSKILYIFDFKHSSLLQAFQAQEDTLDVGRERPLDNLKRNSNLNVNTIIDNDSKNICNNNNNSNNNNSDINYNSNFELPKSTSKIYPLSLSAGTLTKSMFSISDLLSHDTKLCVGSDCDIAHP